MGKTLARVAAALAALATAQAVFGLGFGDLQVNSALNQPLDAEIRLVGVKPAERDQVEIRLASPETFERFGVDRAAAIDRIRVETVAGGEPGQMRVLVSSRQPIREPFVTLLLEARWQGSRALREYTVLLDPPVRTPATRQAPQQTQAASDTRAAPPARADTSSRPAARSRPTQAPARREAAGGRYGPVASNETLWSIAKRVRPSPDIAMNKMLVAIYQSNRDAFDGNINLLHRGAHLSVPPADEIRGISARVADREVADQMQAFAQGQDEPAATAARDEPADEAPTETAPTETATAETTTAETGAGGGELRLEPTAPGSGQGDGAAATSAENGGGTAADAGGTGADDSEQGEGGGETMTALAQTAEDGESGSPSAEAAPAPDRESDSEPAAAPAASGGSEEGAGQAARAPSAPDAGPAAVPEAETSPSAEQTADADSSAAGNETTDTGTATTPAVDAGDSAVVNTTAESVIPESGALLTPRRLLLAAALAMLVVALVLVLRRRQYKPVPVDFAGWEAQPEDERQAESGRQTSQEPPAADPAAGAAESVPRPRQVDLAETLDDADSLIENGLYDEAVGTLELGLESYPDNRDLQHKILEAHYAASDGEAFARTAQRFYPEPDPDDPEWQKIAARGRELTPAHPLFVQPGAAGDEPGVDAPEESADTQDLTDAADDAPEFRGAGERPEEAQASPEPPAADSEAGDEEVGQHLQSLLDDDSTAETETVPEAPHEPEPPRADEDEIEAPEPQEQPDEPGLTAFSVDEAEGESAPAGEGTPAAKGGDEDAGAETAGEEPPAFSVDPAEFGLGTSATESDEPAAGERERKGPNLEAYDLSGFSLDESPEPAGEQGEAADEPEAGRAEPPEPEATEGDAAAGDDAAPGNAAAVPTEAEADDEITTKLDLARAYLDMGEPDMAVSLLEEVRERGDETQQREAETLLERTG